MRLQILATSDLGRPSYLRIRSRQSIAQGGVLPIDDVTLVRARAVTHVGMCAASIDERKLADAVLGCRHGYFLSV